MNAKFLLFALFLFGFSCSSPNKEPASSQESQTLFQIVDDQKLTADEDTLREIHFTELWTWEYLNDEEEWNELWIYREPILNYWLFEKSSSYGVTSEMCEWVVATPEGKYWFNCQDAEMGAVKTLHQQTIAFDSASSLPEFWEETEEEKEFGDTAQGFGTFKGKGYSADFRGQKKTSHFFLHMGDIDMRPVYYFNFLEGDGKLPITFPTGIPDQAVVLSENTDIESHNIRIRYRFKDISPNSYYVELPE